MKHHSNIHVTRLNLSRITLFVLLTLLALPLHAETLLGIISPRNSADVVTGTHRFLLANTIHRVQLRTTDQFSELGEKERRELLQQADIVFAGGVFGNAVSLLNHYLKDPTLVKSFIAVHSDRTLVSASRLKTQAMLQGADIDELMKHQAPDDNLDATAWAARRLKTHAPHADWLLAKTFWANRDTDNIDGLLRHLFNLQGLKMRSLQPKLRAALRVFVSDQAIEPKQLSERLAAENNKRWVAILDYESGDRPGNQALLNQLCQQFEERQRGCLRVLAKWGPASTAAVELLAANKASIAAVVSLQNFVVGGGEGRLQVNAALLELAVPVLKGIRLSDASREEWLLSEQGIRWDSVHYRVAMPELQGVSQPLVLAATTPPQIDSVTGIKLTLSEPIADQVALMGRKLERWLRLQEKANEDKKLAIIYYNHPPGRHNIGADNLNVPASLFEILNRLKTAGYDTGDLPESHEALLDLLQDKGVNLPEDRQALAAMSKNIASVSADQYQTWFNQLPSALQDEMQDGPLAYLHAMLQRALLLDDKEIGRGLMQRVVEDLRHALEGAEHPARNRVLNLLKQLENVYSSSDDSTAATKTVDWDAAKELVDAIAASGVEGIRGWGKAPGKVMVHEQRLLLPGIQFGNVFVGPQPPRGWELNEELLHANLSFPPTHQYLALYHWLRHEQKIDAVVHLGRHSTYEFLPRRRVGMSLEDYPLALIDDLPSVYPYIVDGVGEGIQAKRRGLAVMVDHLTPPLDSTALYDQLLELRQLVESYEAAPEAAGAMRQRAIIAIKALVEELKLVDELVASMSGELQVRGITEFEQVDDELLVHEVGHYLTKLQEDFMPLGLHVFGKQWTDEAVQTMLRSMAKGLVGDDKGGANTPKPKQAWHAKLSASPEAEMQALLAGLAGRYIAPGKGNDPIRTPEVLPTGRNFFALDGSLVPSRLGYQVGVELAQQARAQQLNKGTSAQSQSASTPESEAIVLWASDVVRDEGAMIAFGMDMLGIQPVWSSRGIVKGLQRLDLTELKEHGIPRVRHDTLFTTSGLFRDLYGAHLVWLEQAVLMALDASSDTIREKYPALTLALNSALEPLATKQNPGDEALALNHVAARWVNDAALALQQGIGAEAAGKQAAYRVFGDAPGTYGAGVNRMVERSGSWNDRADVAKVYMTRMGHAYGLNLPGAPLQNVFKQRLNNVGSTYLGRSSNLYGLIDNNDAFDYLGGLSLAVETTRGKAPDNFILFHPDANNVSIEPLSVALLSELRGRFLNPQWLKPLMDEGYAGARTMGSEFLEYLWGWQVTNPDVVKSWVWDEVKAVYIDDKLGLNLDEFLEQNHNAHVKSNMLAVMLVAAQKEFWDADEATLQQLAQQFTALLLENGLPGSGHTTPDHPVYDFLQSYVAAEQYQQLQQLLNASKVDSTVATAPSSITEITLNELESLKATEQTETGKTGDSQQKSEEASEQVSTGEAFEYQYWLIAGLVLLLLLGAYFGTRPVKPER